MKRFVKQFIVVYVVVVSVALVWALPHVLGAPEDLPVEEFAGEQTGAQLPDPQISTSYQEAQPTPANPSTQEEAPLEEAAPVDAFTQESAPAAEAVPLELTPDGWQIIAEGIHYRKYDLPDPNDVFVARMVITDTNVTLDSAIAEGSLYSELVGPGYDGYETVSGMAKRYDQTINYWDKTWGNRNQVVVAINGDYPSVQKDGDKTFIFPQPQHGQIQSGWYAKRYPEATEVTSGNGFVWDLARNAYVGECLTNPKAFITYPSSNTQDFNGVNVPRGSNELIVYTPQFGKNTPTDDNGVEVLVEMERPTSVLYGTGSFAVGYVRAIYNNQGSTPIPFDHIVLSAHGTAKSKLLNENLEPGQKINVSQRVKNCDSSLTFDWKDSYASVGGDYYFLKDNVIQTFPTDAGATARHPRSAILFNNEYVYFVVVDGRNPFDSIGMTIDELAHFAKDVLGATYGIAEDGGGSSTLVINGRVMNNTFCNNVFCKGRIYLPMISKPAGSQSSGTSGIQTPSVQSVTITDPDTGLPAQLEMTSGVTERAVVNSMLMVVVEPITQTVTFNVGDRVAVTANANVRLGPGTNYYPLQTVNAGTQGEVLDHMNGLNGVRATGYNWWRIQFDDGPVGWVAEQLLAPVGN